MTTVHEDSLIVELELWLPPMSALAPMDGKELAAQCRRDTGLVSDVVLGLSFVPDQQDVEQLKLAVELGEVKKEDFRNFCESRGLQSTLEDLTSAAAFLVFIRGQPLAWLHLPANSLGLAMARNIIQWSSRSNIEIHDGSSTYELLSETQIFERWHGAV